MMLVNMVYSCNEWISELKVAYRHSISELTVAVSEKTS
ncbi:hypothetical protein KPSA1_01090 [Pseudomonas syringae pv. actinidiae]|uniref:Uncharacterized protein n=1 Tax=Pseudomonas syringae pv. actinidiae TaxID=103796 RepID=A0A2V0QQ08_PSESF|nr:hypothetical protein KPSA1_01090 [Pseudomonas syringae pv. actinidiae]GBH15001.1 hypothetical protein KPSA3_00918 [Pseudomonas syringae pv. actinidiae]